MSLPWIEPLTKREPAPRTVPEPPRKGDPGGPPCRVCTGSVTQIAWEDAHWTLHPAHRSSLPGTVWVASKVHVDAFSDLPSEVASSFGPMAARVERAILARGDVARVHLYRWGDGGAHFHVWFMPRPLGMIEASGHLLPVWEDVLPNVPDAELDAAAREIAERM